jgi:hypothetical protein
MPSSKCAGFHFTGIAYGDRQSWNGQGRAAIAIACVGMQVYRGDVLLRVKKTLGIRHLRMSVAQYSMHLSG